MGDGTTGGRGACVWRTAPSTGGVGTATTIAGDSVSFFGGDEEGVSNGPGCVADEGVVVIDEAVNGCG